MQVIRQFVFHFVFSMPGDSEQSQVEPYHVAGELMFNLALQWGQGGQRVQFFKIRQDLPVDSVCEFLSAAGVVIKESMTFPVHFTAFVIISLSRLQDALGSISVGSGQPSSE